MENPGTEEQNIVKYRRKHEEQQNYYKPVRVSNFGSNSYIEYESNGDRNNTLSIEEYFKGERKKFLRIQRTFFYNKTCFPRKI